MWNGSNTPSALADVAFFARLGTPSVIRAGSANAKMDRAAEAQHRCGCASPAVGSTTALEAALAANPKWATPPQARPSKTRTSDPSGAALVGSDGSGSVEEWLMPKLPAQRDKFTLELTHRLPFTLERA
jgi:hypothetical protein